MFSKIKTELLIGISVLLLIALVLAGYLYTQEKEAKEKNLVLTEERDLLLEEKKEQNRRITTLENSLQREEAKNEYFEDQISDLSSTVGIIDKITNTDEELLQKYSKIYFLNEHYQPEDLDQVPEEYVYTPDKDILVHSKILDQLEDLMEEAEDDNIDISIVSAYRSFGEQAGLKSSYVFTYGAGTANQFSAEQGYSEHQLGTTIDFTSESIEGRLSGFNSTEAYEWLTKNAHKFGFTLSYPENNSYYQYEPWHWRYVGVDLATRLHKDGIYFYDLSQREIDEYIVSLFD